MAHPRWPGYNSKTGDPVFDNVSANMNRKMWKNVKHRMRIIGASRKRKKHLKRVEGSRYIEIINQVMLAVGREEL